ncbi:hypothetical protein P872_06235 [Rhodonellum psychrophilum GCM71 = DSM 17998]|uniref:Uncharacterized protein n=1 Tax=Rhodonellum psychrophilum GCM71 = DSM 17998 TaxID=1123057 RepID=U5BZS4_9BACT|nr:hypothetical protein P872_06235 [Rhodonellum psychrophilum GCM71 = DSM 17998]
MKEMEFTGCKRAIINKKIPKNYGEIRLSSILKDGLVFNLLIFVKLESSTDNYNPKK